MGVRGLYPTLSTKKNNINKENYMNFLQYSDGKNTIEEISQKIKLNITQTKIVYRVLKDKKLVV